MKKSLIVLATLCSCVLFLTNHAHISAWGAAHAVYGYVTVDGQPEPNIRVQSQAWYNGVRKGLPTVITDSAGYYTIEVSSAADRLNVFIGWPTQFQFVSVTGGDDWWQKPSENTIGVIFDGPATGWLSVDFAATWASTPVPTSTPTLVPTLALTSTPAPTSAPIGLATCTPWPTLKPLAQALIDGVNASRNEPVIIIWGGALQKAAYSHYEFLAMSSETRVEHEGITYIAQGWYGGIFYHAEGEDTVYYTTWFGSGGVVVPCLTYIDTEQSFGPQALELPMINKKVFPAVIGKPTVSIPTPTSDVPDTMLGVAQEKLRSTLRMEKVIYALAAAFLGGTAVAAKFEIDKRKEEA